MPSLKLKNSEPRSRRVTFYSKPNCPLCDDARDILWEAAKRYSLDIIEVNILADPSSYEKYKHMIPVVALDDGLVLWGRIDPDRLTTHLS